MGSQTLSPHVLAWDPPTGIVTEAKLFQALDTDVPVAAEVEDTDFSPRLQVALCAWFRCCGDMVVCDPRSPK